ncbi:hypothetical protein ABLE92_22295 [Gordonia sp. VNQ95]|uniref:hypothetical protein n=1 Tax=Gordonia TaxID=2053 RepID=UPI0032B4F223
MSQSPDLNITGPAVLGVSVLGEEIASVVLDAAGEIVASNFVDLADDSPESALTALTELVDSAPFEIDHIVTTCARPDVRAHLDFALHGPGAPAWAAAVVFVDLPAALAQVAGREGGGVVGVVTLDQSGALATGDTLALVDATAARTIRTAQVSPADAHSLSDAAGATAAAALLRPLTADPSPARFLCVGSGAQLPEVVSAVAAATGRPAAPVGAPVFAVAQGATAVVLADTRAIPVGAAVGGAAVGGAAVGGAAVGHTAPAYATDDAAPTTAIGSHGLRWWAIGGAAGVAALLCLAVLVALFTGVGSETPAAVTSTTTVTGTTGEITVTRAGDPVTQTVVDEQTVTETTTPPTVTRTTAQTVTQTQTQTQTETQTATQTVTESATATVTENETVYVTTTVIEGPP